MRLSFPELQARFVPGRHAVMALDENPQAAERGIIRSEKPGEFRLCHVDHIARRSRMRSTGHKAQRFILDFPAQPFGKGSTYSKCKPRPVFVARSSPRAQGRQFARPPARSPFAKLGDEAPGGCPLFPFASQNLPGLEMNEMDASAGEASHRFVIVILIRYNVDAVLHALVGDRAGEEYVFHSVLVISPCGPSRMTGALTIQANQITDALMLVLRVST